EVLNRVKERFPANDPRLLFQFAFVYQQLSLHEDALKAFQAYVKIEPTNAHGWIGLAGELRHFRMFDDARSAANQAARIEPQNEVAWKELGESYIDEKSFAALAIDPLRRATQLDPEDWHAWIDLAIALQAAGEFAEANAAMNRSAELSKLRTAPGLKDAKPISKSPDGSIVKF